MSQVVLLAGRPASRCVAAGGAITRAGPCPCTGGAGRLGRRPTGGRSPWSGGRPRRRPLGFLAFGGFGFLGRLITLSLLSGGGSDPAEGPPCLSANRDGRQGSPWTARTGAPPTGRTPPALPRGRWHTRPC